MYDSVQVAELFRVKDGKQHDPLTARHENGHKRAEVNSKDGDMVSTKFWNSKGEEIDSWEEARKLPRIKVQETGWGVIAP